MKQKKNLSFHLILYLSVLTILMTVPSAQAKYQGTWTIPLTLTIVSDYSAEEALSEDTTTDDTRTDDTRTDDAMSEDIQDEEMVSPDEVSQEDSLAPESDDTGDADDSAGEESETAP